MALPSARRAPLAQPPVPSATQPVARRLARTGLLPAYCRLTLAFVVGLYLPWAASAPDLLRHFGEAVHSWAILFFAPVAAWRLIADALARPRALGRRSALARQGARGTATRRRG